MKLMLAGKAPELEKLRYPVLVSPKLDGIRAYVWGGRLWSRNNKLIPNGYVQSMFGKAIFNGLDGELIVGDPCSPSCFRDTTSVVMSDFKPCDELRFHAFDIIVAPEVRTPFSKRLEYVRKIVRGRYVVVPHLAAFSSKDVEGQEQAAVDAGYEGVMLRDPSGFYKYGRSTPREGGLLKLKRFEEAEAIVVGFEERMHNGNEKDRFGKRTSHKAGKTGRGDLGALICFDGFVEFNLGSGFTDDERAEIWRNKKKYLEKKVTYKFFPTGSKDLPRFPTFKGFRKDI